MSRTARPAPTALYLTDDDEACRLLAEDPAALLIGFVLDQQVTVQKAFAGPAELRRRVGTIEPVALADMPLATLEEAFAARPALHRFPAAMAKRVQACMRVVADRYDGDAARIWTGARDDADLEARLGELPGFGAGKVLSITSVLARRFGMPFAAWEQQAPEWGTLGDVDAPEALRAYQARKRAWKAQRRASGTA